MLGKLQSFIFDPYPLRTMAEKFLRKCKIGGYQRRLELGLVERPHYGYCVYNAAVLARKFGHRKISVLEFGVAGGEGLINLEYHAQEIEKLLGIEIEIYGFDTGEGLPEPIDYRDMPHLWKKSFYKADVPMLQTKLKKANLVLGDIKKTSQDFFKKYNPAPIGAIVYDLDFYSSTVSALKMLEAGEKYYLPRVFCYADDTLGSELELYSDYTGERLAINEFNLNHDSIKMALPYYLLSRKVVKYWYHQIWICHFFTHSRYNDFISKENQQLPSH